jgi:lysyl-tRNA synthetase, class I
LIEAIRSFTGIPDSPDSAKDLQSKVFSIARANGIEPKEFFALLYRMFLNADRGPRIGNYLLDLGIELTKFYPISYILSFGDRVLTFRSF